MSTSQSTNISEIAVAAANPASDQATYWLALSLTEGLGPTRIKKLIEHYGTAERVFHASLTELEATGMRAVSAQSIATGKSAWPRKHCFARIHILRGRMIQEDVAVSGRFFRAVAGSFPPRGPRPNVATYGPLFQNR